MIASPLPTIVPAAPPDAALLIGHGPAQAVRRDRGAARPRLRPRARRDRRDHGSERLGQVDAPPLPCRDPRPGRGPRDLRRPVRERHGRRRAQPAPTHGLRVRVPVRSARSGARGDRERRAPAAAQRHRPCPGRADGRDLVSRASASTASNVAAPARCRAVRPSASRSLARSSSSQPSCSPTSRPARSTVSRASTSWSS